MKRLLSQSDSFIVDHRALDDSTKGKQDPKATNPVEEDMDEWKPRMVPRSIKLSLKSSSADKLEDILGKGRREV